MKINELKQDLAAAFRWTARLNMNEGIANHLVFAFLIQMIFMSMVRGYTLVQLKLVIWFWWSRTKLMRLKKILN